MEGEEMPDDQLSIPDAVRWAAANSRAIINRSVHGNTITYDWDKAATPPPNDLGKNYVEHAARNPTHFMGTIIPRFLGDDKDKTGVSDEDLAKDKKLLREIDKVLEQFAEEK